MSIILSQLQQDFADWRSKKKHNKEKIPPYLWQKLYQLGSQNDSSLGSALNTLNISRDQYRQAIEKRSLHIIPSENIIDKAQYDESTAFVHVPTSQSLESINSCVITKPSGVTIKLHNMAQDQLLILVQALLRFTRMLQLTPHHQLYLAVEPIDL